MACAPRSLDFRDTPLSTASARKHDQQQRNGPRHLAGPEGPPGFTARAEKHSHLIKEEVRSVMSVRDDASAAREHVTSGTAELAARGYLAGVAR